MKICNIIYIVNQYSRNVIIWYFPPRLKVLNMKDGNTLFETAKQKTVDIVFSTKNRFVALWEPFYTTPNNPQGNNNFEIFNWKTGECVKSVIHKRQLYW